MASDGLGPDGIEVDGVMPWPSNPMPCKSKCARVFAPIAFSVGKTFLKKFLRNGGMSGMSVVFIDRISSRFIPFIPLESEQIRSRDPLLCKKQKPTEKPIGGLPL
jgi:hypothetical protein